MRKEFAKNLEQLALENEKIVFLTGDLGFMAFEQLQKSLGARFINAGVAEQNMIGVAAGLAKQGFLPFVYSIAPFVTYRCLEQIRNDIMFSNLPVTIVGNGGGYGYGIMGATHHAIEDYGVLAPLGLKSYVPMLNSDINSALKTILHSQKPAYLRLGYGEIKDEIPSFAPFRQLAKGEELTVVTIGPVSIDAYSAAKDFYGKIDLWNFTEFPFLQIPDEVFTSIKKTGKLVCIEEHTQQGGFCESFVSHVVSKTGGGFDSTLITAKGYPSQTYGSQAFHKKECGLDEDSLKLIFTTLLKEK